jgi:hypothetical protein
MNADNMPPVRIEPKITLPPFAHVEAFKLMFYASKDGKRIERIWNSRDGVTPFGIYAPNGDGHDELHHVAWKADAFEAMHVPAVGDFVFVSLSLERAIAYRQKFADANPTHEGIAQFPGGLAKWVEVAAKHDVGSGGAPECAIVDEAMREAFIKRRNEFVRPFIKADLDRARSGLIMPSADEVAAVNRHDRRAQEAINGHGKDRL